MRARRLPPGDAANAEQFQPLYIFSFWVFLSFVPVLPVRVQPIGFPQGGWAWLLGKVPQPVLRWGRCDPPNGRGGTDPLSHILFIRVDIFCFKTSHFILKNPQTQRLAPKLPIIGKRNNLFLYRRVAPVTH